MSRSIVRELISERRRRTAMREMIESFLASQLLADVPRATRAAIHQHFAQLPARTDDSDDEFMALVIDAHAFKIAHDASQKP